MVSPTFTSSVGSGFAQEFLSNTTGTFSRAAVYVTPMMPGSLTITVGIATGPRTVANAASSACQNVKVTSSPFEFVSLPANPGCASTASTTYFLFVICSNCVVVCGVSAIVAHTQGQTGNSYTQGLSGALGAQLSNGRDVIFAVYTDGLMPCLGLVSC
jgi:hypothetical protein